MYVTYLKDNPRTYMVPFLGNPEVRHTLTTLVELVTNCNVVSIEINESYFVLATT